MKLIHRVEISGFRSIQSVEMSDLGHFTAIVGKNSSGKSNVLRALNLFFNGNVDSGRKIDFGRDHYEQEPRIKKKKRVQVAVDFELPDNFKFRPGLQHLKGLGKKFTLYRRWELDPRREPYDLFLIDGSKKELEDPDSAARQFVGLISYRYVPNRTVPARLIREESQAIARSLFIRMKGKGEAEALLRSLDAAGERLLQRAADTMGRAGAPFTSPSIATASSLGEMLTVSGFKATGPSGVPVSDEEWGSGHQAFFLYQLLHALDTNYGLFYGWRQATIWGLEEPESALHRDLETQLVERLREWTRDESNKIQIIHTTHSPIATMASDAGFWTELDGPRSSVAPMPIQNLARRAELKGVSGWIHPVLSFPWNPVVIVEGDIDLAVLGHAAEIGGFQHLRFLTLPKLDTSEHGGGKDALIGYLRRNQDLIGNRPSESPLIALFDWEVSPQDMRKARAAYGLYGDIHVIKMDPSAADPVMGRDFKGIERFYPPDTIREAHEAGELVLGVPRIAGRPYSISAAELQSAKSSLLDRFRAITEREQIKPLLSVLLQIERAVRGHSLQLELIENDQPLST
jgi:hypothetical protein